MSRPSAREWAAALPGLRPSGRGWHGPCPIPGCGGDDRFHVSADGRVGCRHCIDGKPASTKRERFALALRRAFPERSRTPAANGKPRRAAPRPSASPEPEDGEASALRARIWKAGKTCEARNPARRYLEGRLSVPPLGMGLPIPDDSVRWLPRKDAPAPQAGWAAIPTWCAGLVLFAFRSADGDLAAISVEGVDRHGRRHSGEKRFRRSCGRKATGLFAVERPGAKRVVACEGEVSALAALYLYPDALTVATGGTAGLANLPQTLARRWPGLPLILDIDGDGPGRKAAYHLARRHRAECRWRRTGDAADALQAVVAFAGDPAIRSHPATWPEWLRRGAWTLHLENLSLGDAYGT